MPIKDPEKRKEYRKKYRKSVAQQEKNAQHQQDHRNREGKIPNYHAVYAMAEMISRNTGNPITKPGCVGEKLWGETVANIEGIKEYRNRIYEGETVAIIHPPEEMLAGDCD
jgi:hypothetical protein